MFIGDPYQITESYLKRYPKANFKLGEKLTLKVTRFGQIVLRGEKYETGISQILDLLDEMRVPDDEDDLDRE